MTKTTTRSRHILPTTLCLCTLLTATAHADSPARQGSDFASGAGNILYLAAGVGLPLLSDGSNGRNHALRVMDAAGTSLVVTEGLKYLALEKRPDSNEHDSFPSGHATAAFAVATAESEMHPKQAPLWYLGATLVGFSRLRLHRHYPRDVIAGALIGYTGARLEMAAPRGLILSPIISPDSGTVGLQMTKGL